MTLLNAGGRRLHTGAFDLKRLQVAFFLFSGSHYGAILQKPSLLPDQLLFLEPEGERYLVLRLCSRLRLAAGFPDVWRADVSAAAGLGGAAAILEAGGLSRERRRPRNGLQGQI
ncbi:hypothetical protein NDU88_000601 [Pleurodeles waltl]|uniref:Uncharacterized protein n=1 Tax=Pleurodeles waltl TaxID=8319 RepID=A0AAV7L926_PLEWA|nr:hypothetical protein NDU88_000601 [Pleurodeles waltl]